MSKKCECCGAFHYGGKRALRKFRGFLRRLYRKNSKNMAEYIDNKILEEIMSPAIYSFRRFDFYENREDE